jgi:hypothetical protein
MKSLKWVVDVITTPFLWLLWIALCAIDPPKSEKNGPRW